MSKKKIIIIITTLLVFISLILGLIYLPFINFEYTKKDIKNWISQGKETQKTGRKITEYKNGDNFDSIYNLFYNKVEFVITKNNPINPTISVVKGEKTTARIFVDIYEMKRTGITSYDLIEQYGAIITNKTFPEAIAIAQKYDLSKENPDPENIRVQTPPTKAEVEDSKKRAEERKREGEISDEKDYWNTYIKPSNSENKTEKKEFIEKYLKTLIEFKARREQDPAGEIEFYKIKCTPERAKTTDFKMCDFDDGIKLSNQYLKELEENK